MKILKVSFWQYMPWKKIGSIILISILFLLPFALLNHFVKLNIFVAGAIGVVYVLAVWLMELKHGLFIVSKETLTNYLSKIKIFKKENKTRSNK